MISGETLSTHKARQRKIPGRLVVVPETFSITKRALLVLFFKFCILLSRLSSKKVENNSDKIFELTRGRNHVVK